MNKRINRITCIRPAAVIFLIFAMHWPLFAEGTSSVSFLRLGVGPRAAAMGDAFASISDNATAIFWNPAGLSFLKWREAYLSHQVWIENVRISHVAYAQPTLGGTLAVGLANLASGEMEGRDEQDHVTGNFDVMDQAISVGYGRRLGSRFAVGAGAKVLQEKIDDEKGSGWAGDAGALLDFPLEDQLVRWGIALKDAGPGIGAGRKSDLPTTVRLGVSDRLLNESLILSVDSAISKENVRVGAGAEIFLAGSFSLRTGYRFLEDDVSGLGGLTAGFGAIFSAGWDYVLDYAYAGQGDLGLSHRLSLSLRF